MSDLKNPNLIIAKGLLFLLLGLLTFGLIIAEAPSWKILFLLVVSIWGFCRFYYFAFYVIEHYVDSGYRFAGLWDFAKYLLFRRRPATGTRLSDEPLGRETRTSPDSITPEKPPSISNQN